MADRDPSAVDSRDEMLRRKILLDPMGLPDAWKSALVSFLETQDLSVPLTQIHGLKSRVRHATDNDSSWAQTTSTSYGDPNVQGSPGPTISDLDPGTYFVIFGCHTDINNARGYAAISANGATPSDTESIKDDAASFHSSFRAISVSVTQDKNTLKMVYKIDSSPADAIGAAFMHRYIIAIRTD